MEGAIQPLHRPSPGTRTALLTLARPTCYNHRHRVGVSLGSYAKGESMSGYWFTVCGIVAIVLFGCSDAGNTRSGETHSPEPNASASTRDSDSEASPDASDHPPWKLIGKSLDDFDVKAYLSQSNSVPDREDAPGYGVFVSLNSDGVELSADTDRIITTVIIYSARSGQYERYTGPMPRSLSWDMTKARVEDLVGKPAKESFARNPMTGHNELYAEYPALDMYVNYLARSDSDMRAQPIDIRIKNPDL